MQKKRTASLPIFNCGKRPRQALLTHPNNVDAGSLEQQKQQDGRWNSNSQYYGKTQQGHGQARYSSYPNNQLKSVTTNSSAPHVHMPGRTGGYNQSRSNKENLHTTTSFRPFSGSRNTDGPPPDASGHSHNQTHSNATYGSSNTNRGLGFTPHNSHPGTRRPTLTHPTAMSRSFSPAPSSASPAPGRAVEPTMYHSAKLEPSASAPMSVQKSSHLPRVLTATAKGIEHWSQFKSHIPMMFEIFGTLNSAVVAGPLNSREFSVMTRDGTLRCLYWEMDTALPHLVRGKTLRVVGSWDGGQGWVKCHSVREATQQETQSTDQLVAVCDAKMRETVTRLPEL